MSKLIIKSGNYPVFKCRRCGECCDNTPSITLSDVMRLTPKERENLDVLTNIEVAYPVIINGCVDYVTQVSPLIISPKSVNGKCVFFNGNCLINERKPGECLLNPLGVNVSVSNGVFTAKPVIANYCEGIRKGSSRSNFIDDLFFEHLREMIMHEYFIVNLKKIPLTINKLMGLWVNEVSKLRKLPLELMLDAINERRLLANSKVIFRCCL